MHYLILTFNHRNCDIGTREKLSLKELDVVTSFSRDLLQSGGATEIVVLSTCNRIEIITATLHPHIATESILDQLNRISGIPKLELEGRADIFEDEGAIHHLFSVAASLDSLVIGETQIVGQLKDAFRFSQERKLCGHYLSRLMQTAFQCSAEVRTSTDITKNPVSISSVAVQQAKEILGELNDLYAVVVGAGEMSRLAIKHLLASGVYVILLNRSEEKARALALEIGGAIMVKPFETLAETLNHYPLLFSATSAPHAIIKKEMVRDVGFQRLWFDLALPRDIEEGCNPDIRLFQIDDLRHIVEQNKTMRQEQANEAYAVIGRYTKEFSGWLSHLSVEPVIKGIREQAKACSLRKLKEAIEKGHIPPDQKENIQKLLHSVFNAFLHTPTINLKSIASDSHADTVIDTLNILFELQENTDRKEEELPLKEVFQ